MQIICAVTSLDHRVSLLPISSFTLRLTRLAASLEVSAPGYLPTPERTYQLSLYVDGVEHVVEAVIKTWTVTDAVARIEASGVTRHTRAAMAVVEDSVADFMGSTRIPPYFDLLPGDTLNGRAVSSVTHYISSNQASTEAFHRG